MDSSKTNCRYFIAHDFFLQEKCRATSERSGYFEVSQHFLKFMNSFSE